MSLGSKCAQSWQEKRMNKCIKVIGKLAATSLLVVSFSGNASIVNSQVGIPALTGSDGSGSLTNGWIDSGLGWTHSYSQITDTIVSASLTIDIIDADHGSLRLFSGLDNSGLFIGNAFGNDNGNGTRGIWQGLNGNTIETTFVLPQEMYADLSDGIFQVYGDNNSLVTGGANRALLSVEGSSLSDISSFSTDVSSVPVPASAWLLGSGIIGLVGVARRKTRI